MYLVLLLIGFAHAAEPDAFARADANHDGVVTVDEMAVGAGGRAQAAGLIAMFDLNGDARWSNKEFSTWKTTVQHGFLAVAPEAIPRGPSLEQIALQSLTERDRDASGELDDSELGPGATATFDADGSGGIGRGEYLTMQMATMDRLQTVQALANTLMMTDDDRNGRLSVPELQRGARMLPEDIRLDAAASGAFDPAGDGLDRAEQVSWVAAGVQAAMFRYADQDGDGRLSSKELASRLLLDPPPHIFGQADKDGSGGLELAELVAVRRMNANVAR